MARRRVRFLVADKKGGIKNFLKEPEARKFAAKLEAKGVKVTAIRRTPRSLKVDNTGVVSQLKRKVKRRPIGLGDFL